MISNTNQNNNHTTYVVWLITRTGYIFASKYKVIQWLLLDHYSVCVAAASAAAAAAAAAVKSFINNARKVNWWPFGYLDIKIVDSVAISVPINLHVQVWRAVPQQMASRSPEGQFVIFRWPWHKIYWCHCNRHVNKPLYPKFHRCTIISFVNKC